MDANARTGRRGGGKLGSEECKVFGAYGRDTLNDNNIVTTHVKMFGRFARNRPVRESKGPPPIDRRRLTNDLHLRQEVATVLGEQLLRHGHMTASFTRA